MTHHAEQLRKMEKLGELLNERCLDREVTDKEIDDCCDAAGVGIVSSPDSWFYDRVPGRFGDVVLLFRNEYHDNYDFVVVREHYNPGLAPGPDYIWLVFVLPFYAKATPEVAAAIATGDRYRQGRSTLEDRRLLAALSLDERMAVKRAVIDWVETARGAGYEPMAGWSSFMVEADHSALLMRVLEGKQPLTTPPPKRNGYPDYDAAERTP